MSTRPLLNNILAVCISLVAPLRRCPGRVGIGRNWSTGAPKSAAYRMIPSVALLASYLLFAGCDQMRSGSSADSAGKAVSQPTSLNADEVVLGGAAAADFELLDLKGTKHNLADYRGKVVMLNLWASWCAPCVAEMPSIERLYQSLKDQGLIVLAVNVDSPGARKKVEEFVQTSSLTFPILLDPRFTVPEKYLINGFPESVFIGRDGKILLFNDPKPDGVEAVARVVGDRPWDSGSYVEAVRALLQ